MLSRRRRAKVLGCHYEGHLCGLIWPDVNIHRFSLPFDRLRGAGSMVLYLYCVSFFAPQGEKRGCPLGDKVLNMTGRRILYYGRPIMIGRWP